VERAVEDVSAAAVGAREGVVDDGEPAVGGSEVEIGRKVARQGADDVDDVSCELNHLVVL